MKVLSLKLLRPSMLILTAGGRHPGEVIAGELASLLGVEDFRAPVAPDHFFHGLHAEIGSRMLETYRVLTLPLYQVHHRHRVNETQA